MFFLSLHCKRQFQFKIERINPFLTLMIIDLTQNLFWKKLKKIQKIFFFVFTKTCSVLFYLSIHENSSDMKSLHAPVPAESV